jgi:CxxC-x17-CxxC domain-containing protein
MFKKDFKGPGGFKGRDDRGSAPGGFRGKTGYAPGGSRERRRTELFQATCSNCGKACEVPFRPNGKKPVYCSNCFNSERQGSAANFPKENFERKDARPASFTPRGEGNDAILALQRQVNALNIKIDSVLGILQAGARPVMPEAKKEYIPPTKNEIQEDVRKGLIKKRIAKRAARK